MFGLLDGVRDQFTTAAETVTLTLSGPNPPTSLHVWQTQFGWDGMVQTPSSFFKKMSDVPVVSGKVTITVPVDAIITLTTINNSTCSTAFVFGSVNGGLCMLLSVWQCVSAGERVRRHSECRTGQESECMHPPRLCAHVSRVCLPPACSAG